MTTATPYAAPKRRRLTWPLALGVIVLSLALTIPSVVFFARPFVHTFTAPVHQAPGTVTLHLDKATYDIYVETPSERGDLFGQVVLARVTAPDGTGVPTRPITGSSETFTRNGTTYHAFQRFDTRAAGDYRVGVQLPGANGQVVGYFVARSLESTFRQAAPWLAPMLIGGMGVVTGIILLIIALVRGGRRPAVAPAGGWAPGPGAPVGTPMSAPLPAAGWYADPQQPARWRYWDGTVWTDHTS
jgi:Protein of unknown function (DUF2510)